MVLRLQAPSSKRPYSQSLRVNANGYTLEFSEQTGESASPFATTLPWVHSVEHGIIYGWTGNPLYLPDGFVICDGTNGTPDLRDRFIVGALNTYGVGEKNGVTVHVHSFTSDLHAHFLEAGTNIAAGATIDNNFTPTNIQGTTDQSDLTPPFYALCFLMKL